jgi:uncharacterized protein YjiS (DUF1127 family)
MSTLVHHPLTNYQFASPGRMGRHGGIVARAVGFVRVWLKRIRERRELAVLSERELRDIGVTPAEVFWETEKPFWRD